MPSSRKTRDLRTYLEATGNTELGEANPTDTMFGIGLSLNNPAAVDKSCWVGDNLLGSTLMLVRDETKLMEIATDRLC